MATSVNGYVIRGVDGELLLVVRSRDEDLIYTIIERIKKSRDKKVRELAEHLEEMYFDKFNGRNT